MSLKITEVKMPVVSFFGKDEHEQPVEKIFVDIRVVAAVAIEGIQRIAHLEFVINQILRQ